MRFLSHFSAYGMLVEPPRPRHRLRAQPGPWRTQLGQALVALGLRLMTPSVMRS